MNGQSREFGMRDLEAGCLVLVKNKASASDFSLLLILPARAVGGVRAGTTGAFLSPRTVVGAGERTGGASDRIAPGPFPGVLGWLSDLAEHLVVT